MLVRILAASALFAPSLLFATEAPHSPGLGALIASGQLALVPTGLGGHQGERLQVVVRNNTAQEVRTSIPPGWVFVSEDTTVQDLIVVRNAMIALAPRSSSTVTCRAFCSESSRSSPDVGEVFLQGRQANEKLTALASFIDKGDYPDDAVQSAVWVLSDGHAISSVSADDMASIKPLREELSRLTGQPVPWYSTAFAHQPGTVFSNEPTHVRGDVSFHLPNNATIALGVYDAQHQLVRQLGKEQAFGPGEYDIAVELTVRGWARGEYEIRIIADGNNVVRKIPFRL